MYFNPLKYHNSIFVLCAYTYQQYTGKRRQFYLQHSISESDHCDVHNLTEHLFCPLFRNLAFVAAAVTYRKLQWLKRNGLYARKCAKGY